VRSNFVSALFFTMELETIMSSPRNNNYETVPDQNYFKLKNFMRELKNITETKDPDKLESYLQENMADLYNTISAGSEVKAITDLFHMHPSYYALITLFNPNWLKSRTHFNKPSFLGLYLNGLPLEQWQYFLDHLGKSWLRALLTGSSLNSMMINLTGSANGTDQCDQFDALFSYLGLEWLRCLFKDSHHLGDFLIYWDNSNRNPMLLSFLNGHDHWLERRILYNSSDIGYILNRIANYHEHGFSMFFRSNSNLEQQAELQTQTLENWKKFLAFLNPKSRKNIFTNRWELPTLLNELDVGFWPNERTKMTELFLKEYFEEENISDLEQLIDALSSLLTLAKCMLLIQNFSAAQIHKIIYANNSFERTQHAVDQYKHMLFYRPLLLALVRAYHYEQEKNLTQSSQENLIFANSLINAIKNNITVENTYTITQGPIGEIYKSYSSDRLLASVNLPRGR
jgi:hypothetical protein